MDGDIIIREARLEDIDEIVRQRRRMYEAMIDWCRQRGFQSVSLHSSDDGRPLYESLGFKPTQEMKLVLR